LGVVHRFFRRWSLANSFAAFQESGIGTYRQFAALHQFGSNWRRSGHSAGVYRPNISPSHHLAAIHRPAVRHPVGGALKISGLRAVGRCAAKPTDKNLSKKGVLLRARRVGCSIAVSKRKPNRLMLRATKLDRLGRSTRCVKDVFCRKIFGAGRDSAGGALAVLRKHSTEGRTPDAVDPQITGRFLYISGPGARVLLGG
jgi:hypothetical protein